MLILRACPHCRGDLVVEQDTGCGYLECVQCGHVLSRKQELALGVRVSDDGVLMHKTPHTAPARGRTRASPALITRG